MKFFPFQFGLFLLWWTHSLLPFSSHSHVGPEHLTLQCLKQLPSFPPPLTLGLSRFAFFFILFVVFDQSKPKLSSYHFTAKNLGLTYFLPYKSKDFQGPSKVHSLCSLKFLIDPFCTVLSTTCTILLTLVTHHECLLPRCFFVKCYPCFKIPVMEFYVLIWLA